MYLCSTIHTIMLHKIVIALDSFKGCMTSLEAGKSIARGIYEEFPECEVKVMPVADGGEGLLDALVDITGGQILKIQVHDPLMETRQACYGLSADGSTAFVEMAQASGLPLVPKESRNPLLTTSYGTGELIADALRRGCRQLFVGLGGSATNDAGIGLLQALGMHFLDKEGLEVKPGGQALAQVEYIDTSRLMPEAASTHFIAACDVHNPLYGPEGAAHVFAPQKGATPEMVRLLDEGLRHFADVVHAHTGLDISTLQGAGAAGGIGGSLSAFLHADLKPGIELVLESGDFPALIDGADLIITGEGRADLQTLMGKVPAGILTMARRQGIPVILLAGQVKDVPELLQAGFQDVRCINPPDISLAIAMRPDFAIRQVRQAALEAIRDFLKGHG